MIAGKYRIDRVLGEGGMGSVFAAHHTLLDQAVAVKLLYAETAKDKDAVARFLQEARAAARIHSEHVVRVMDVAVLDSGIPFIVMEYLEGSDLSGLLEKRGPLPVREVCDYAIQALDAIAQAHAQGIVHRDLKPSNLFLAQRPDGTSGIKILDFGISKSLFNHPHAGPVGARTTAGTVLGSPFYMSPEQVRSTRNVDARTDIWSLGVVLYELLTGRLPFLGEEMGEIFAAILENEPVPVRKIRPEVPKDLEAVITRCLQRQRENRYPNVGQLARALAPLGSGKLGRLIERIDQTLTWGDELSRPGKTPAPRAISGVVATGPASAHAAPAQTATVVNDPWESREMIPTASTVRRDAEMRRRKPWLVLAASSIALAALTALVVVVFVTRQPSKSANGAAGSQPSSPAQTFASESATPATSDIATAGSPTPIDPAPSSTAPAAQAATTTRLKNAKTPAGHAPAPPKTTVATPPSPPPSPPPPATTVPKAQGGHTPLE